MLSTLAADRARIADLDTQIQDLQRSLSVLQRERSLVQGRLDAYNYPVLTLPNEIICEIFTRFLPIYPKCPPLIGPLSPIFLTHICRGWRKIALSFAALWRATDISWNHSAPDVVSAVLSRSGLCPLSIRMDAPELNPDLDHYGPELLAAAIPHYTRWEYLTLHLTEHFTDANYPRIDGPMPLLQHLDLWLNGGSSYPVVSLRSGAPLLRTVILNDYAAAKVILPWVQLTSLTLTIIYLHECVPILQQTSNLIHCVLELCDSDDVVSDGAVTLPSLETLAIKELDPTTMEPINYLRTFIVPALGDLEVPERFLGLDPIDSLASLISKSGCKLHQVGITDSTLGLEAPFRAAFPSMQMLFIRPIVDDAESVASD
ncbi:hypothetical protein DFH08DRAFT_387805 [Mycena albidolilacea]|uniref:F-box domain-containing protein n=1 Tax=Mycena albidolilacea TaxID=1033008 RepID=A0AAD7EH02_9AGAR|nr:hypothetical protein DFH08DRAFT_387805 [Mycena albidolilacea]